MDTKGLIIRHERKEDYRNVENLIRESFWNVYRPGCSEHYVMHVLRDDPAFIKELDFVMEKDGLLIGQNMFMKTVINADDGTDVPVLTMGPICITPKLKRKGYGKYLLDYCLEKATERGDSAAPETPSDEVWTSSDSPSTDSTAISDRGGRSSTFITKTASWKPRIRKMSATIPDAAPFDTLSFRTRLHISRSSDYTIQI